MGWMTYYFKLASQAKMTLTNKNISCNNTYVRVHVVYSSKISFTFLLTEIEEVKLMGKNNESPRYY